MAKKIKVLRIFNRFIIGGPLTNVLLLSRDLAKDEFDTLLIGGLPEKAEKSALQILQSNKIRPRIIYSLVRRLNPILDYKAFKEIRNQIREFKPDVVHTHGAKSGFLGRLAASKESVNVIVHTYHGHVFHSYFNAFVTKFYLFLERSIGKKTNKIIVLSKSQQNEIVNKYKIVSHKKTEIIPLALDENAFDSAEEAGRNFRLKYELDAETVAIGIVGRLVKIKNLDLFIQSIAQLNLLNTKPWKAFIIGGGEEMPRLKVMVQSLGLKDKVIFTSWITPSVNAIAGLDIVALTSDNEGTPLSLIESAFLAKAIIATDVGGVKDIFNQNEAVIVKSGDLVNFTKGLLELIENPDYRKKLGDNAKLMSIAKFRSGRLINDIETLYKELLGRK